MCHYQCPSIVLKAHFCKLVVYVFTYFDYLSFHKKDDFKHTLNLSAGMEHAIFDKNHLSKESMHHQKNFDYFLDHVSFSIMPLKKFEFTMEHLPIKYQYTLLQNCYHGTGPRKATYWSLTNLHIQRQLKCRMCCTTSL